MFPLSRTSRFFWFLLAVLALLRVAGRHDVRFGPGVPDVSLWWFGLLLTAAAFLVGPSRKRLRQWPMTVLVVGLLVVVWPLSAWRDSVVRITPQKTVRVYRPFAEEPGRARRVLVDALRLESRKDLNRVARRRRDVGLELIAVLSAPRAGVYRFETDCDDRCSLWVDGTPVVQGAAFGQEELHLDAGMHRFRMRYEQDRGPAHLALRWNSPAFLEILGLEHHVADSADRLTAPERRRAFWRIVLSLLLGTVWWCLGCGLLLRGMEHVSGLAADEPALGPSPSRAAVFLALGCGLAVPVLDITVWGTPDRRLGPTFDPPDVLRSLLLLASAAWFVGFIHLRSRAAGGASAVAWPGDSFRVARWPLLLVPLGFALLHAHDAELFSMLGREDGLIENASAVLLFLTTALAVAGAWLFRRRGARFRAFVAAAFAFVFFVIGGEEISWGQRIVGFESPTPFLENDQAETNLHNIATDLFEQAYYSLATVFLILVPFVQERSSSLRRFSVMQFVIPSIAIAFASAPLSAFNYDTWRFPLVQWLFYATVIVCLYYAMLFFRKGVGGITDKIYYALLPISLVAIQAELLIVGNFSRYWDVTEYKELLIPLGFLVFAMELLVRARRETGLK